jgi:hypothetical protein
MTSIDKLQTTVEAFCQFIEALPKTAFSEREWGAKEVLAHILYHHENYVAEIKAQLAGEPYDLPKGRFSDLNTQAAEAARGVPVEELLHRLRVADEQLRDFYRLHDPETLIVNIKKGGKSWTLAELVPAIESHVRNHQKQLEKELR